MLASKGSMLSSKGNMLSCMILLAIELDVRAQLLARIIVQSVDAPEQDHMLSCMILFLMLARITRRAFSKCLRANLDSQAVKYCTCKHKYHVTRIQGISRKLASRFPFSKSNVFLEGTGNSAIILLPRVKTP